jgi:UDP-glucuronate 4-epimerase
MIRILLTGCSGFIGSNFLRYVFSKTIHYSILGVDHKSCSFVHPNFTFLLKSIQELSLQDLSGITHILHLAARTGVRQSTTQAEDYFEQNVKATHHLLELAKQLKIKTFLFASSSSVYGDNPGQSESEQPILPFACKSFYALSKQQCEVLTHFYAQTYGIQCIGLRFFTVYGPSPRTDMLIGKAIESAKTCTPLPFFGIPKNTLRSFTYVDDVISCILKLLEKENLPIWSIWNIGNPNSIDCQTVLDCLTSELQKYGHTLTIKYFEKNNLDTIETRADITKASTELHWIPLTDIKEGIQKTIYSQFN